MNVRDLTIVLRPRKGWEAVDLGTALSKRYFRDLFRIGFMAFMPVFLVLALCCWKLPLLLPVLIWWLKPLLDRFYLFYLSRRIFGQQVTVKETWREWRRLLLRGTIALLTWRRFAPSRSMTMAISDLENLAGAARSQRIGVLSRMHGGEAVLVTLGGLVLELIGLLSLLFVSQLFMPQGQGPEWDGMVLWFGQGGVGQTVLMLFFGLSYGLLVFLLEPFYLAHGFSLYLNSRTSQEGWDIELRFRELASRVAKTRLQSPASAEPPSSEPSLNQEQKPKFQFVGSKQSLALFLTMGLALLTGGSELLAQELDPQLVVERVLQHEDFTNHVEKYKEWVPNEGSWMERWRQWLKDREGRNGSGSNGARTSSGSGGAFNGVFQLLGYMALALLALVLVVLMVNLFRNRSPLVSERQKKFKRPPPRVIMGMEVTPESLPDDLLGKARHLWSQGEHRLAMSLLYRGALSDLITEQEVGIESSDTESECLTQVEAAAPKILAGYFQLLSSQWMKAAYSNELVEAEAFERLCTTWPFGRRGR